MSPADPRAAAAAEARRLSALGFLACTAGNLSVRLADGAVAISASGLDKGSLTEGDFIPLGSDGRPLAGDPRKPSDETGLHLALYRHLGCAAVCHGHPPHAVALSMLPGPQLRVSGIEMQKAFAGITTHAGTVTLPVVDNSQDMQELAVRAVNASVPGMPAVVVRGHGVYAWGRSIAEASRHLETVEWLCRIAWLCRVADIPLPGL